MNRKFWASFRWTRALVRVVSVWVVSAQAVVQHFPATLSEIYSMLGRGLIIFELYKSFDPTLYFLARSLSFFRRDLMNTSIARPPRAAIDLASLSCSNFLKFGKFLARLFQPFSRRTDVEASRKWEKYLFDLIHFRCIYCTILLIKLANCFRHRSWTSSRYIFDDLNLLFMV